MRSVLDRSDREDVRLHQPRCVNTSAFGLRGYGQHSPLSLLCITMILRVRRKFFEITTFPNTDEGARRPPSLMMMPALRVSRPSGVSAAGSALTPSRAGVPEECDEDREEEEEEEDPNLLGAHGDGLLGSVPPWRRARER